MDVEEVEQFLMLVVFGDGSFVLYMVDKFFLYVYCINFLKMGVCIIDQYKVCLGVYFGEGIMLMLGVSYINFNVGIEGVFMVEGCISFFVLVGVGIDIGGGVFMLGVFFGGNNVFIFLGCNCLLEVNFVLGILVGDVVIVVVEIVVMVLFCVVVQIEGYLLNGKVVKVVELVGINVVMFCCNDVIGVFEVLCIGCNIDFVKKLEDGEDILNSDLYKN